MARAMERGHLESVGGARCANAWHVVKDRGRESARERERARGSERERERARERARDTGSERESGRARERARASERESQKSASTGCNKSTAEHQDRHSRRSTFTSAGPTAERILPGTARQALRANACQAFSQVKVARTV